MNLASTFTILCLLKILTGADSQSFYVEVKDKDGVSITQTVRNLKIFPDIINVHITSSHHNATYRVKKYENALASNIPVHITGGDAKTKTEILANHIVCYRAHDNGYDVNVALWEATLFPTHLQKSETSLMLDVIIKNTSTVLTGEVNLNDQKNSFLNWYKRNEIRKKLYENKHVLYEKQRESAPRRYFKQNDGNLRDKRAIRESNIANIRYVETYVIVDSSFFDAMNQSVANTTSKVVQIINGVDVLYRRLDIRVVLVGIDIWKNRDLVPIALSAVFTLQNLTLHGENIRHVDNIQLLTVRSFKDNIQGLGYVGGMCSHKYSMGINSLKKGRPLSDIVTVMSHEIGHNFNMSHDDEDASSACTCRGDLDYCIMDSSNHQVSAMHWSDCSMKSAKDYVQSGKSMCLNNQPALNIASRGVCGNSIKEGDEECDCGDENYCDDPCCNTATCKLKVNAECSSGPCCQSCQRIANGTVCRTSNDECDIADTCDATGHCHHRYIEDGTPCDSKRGICHDGVCHSRKAQCQSVWGQGTHDGIRQCYTSLNEVGEYYGHCGGSDGNYTKCTGDNVYCGLLQCTNIAKNKPVIGRFITRSLARLRVVDAYHTCNGVSVDLGRQQRDPGMVHNWTPCGDAENHFCLNAKCLHHVFTPKCNSSCDGDDHVCDNNGACITPTTESTDTETAWHISKFFESPAGRLKARWILMIGNVLFILLMSFEQEAIRFDPVITGFF